MISWGIGYLITYFNTGGERGVDVVLRNQVALVTGSSRGIGRSISLALAKTGAHVVLSARTITKLEDVQKEINEAGGAATIIPTDLENDDSIVELFSIIKDRFGKLDILVNNAGIGLWGKLVDFPIEDFDKLVRLNLRSTYLCCQQAMKLMMPAKRGFIINISSVVGVKGYPNQSAYTMTKHGIMGLTKSLAVEAQEHNIYVAVILPGAVDTGLSASGRPDIERSKLILPEDIAKAVLFLFSLSDRAWVDQIYVRRRTSTPF
ncbi:MAG: SDR family NAD(P)-dependent oxidoreductase [Spirochaetota bacterium]